MSSLRSAEESFRFEILTVAGTMAIVTNERSFVFILAVIENAPRQARFSRDHVQRSIGWLQ
jgi:hypothetical protein